MALAVADLSEHIIARWRLYALALESDIDFARASWRKLCAWPMRQRSQTKHHKRRAPSNLPEDLAGGPRAARPHHRRMRGGSPTLSTA
jgi:hypothetical protein